MTLRAQNCITPQGSPRASFDNRVCSANSGNFTNHDGDTDDNYKIYRNYT